MNSLAILIQFLFLFLFTGNTSCVKIFSSESRDWNSGIPNGGYGTDYTIKLLTRNKKIVVDSMWVKQSVSACAVIARPQGDTLILQSSLSRMPEAIQTPAPIKYKGEGLLRYYQNGKRHYLVIKHFKKLPLLNYQ